MKKRLNELKQTMRWTDAELAEFIKEIAGEVAKEIFKEHSTEMNESHKMTEEEKRSIISQHLASVGYPISHIGFKYSIEAILYYMDNEPKKRNGVYPFLCEKFERDKTCIIASVCFDIKKAKSVNTASFEEVFGDKDITPTQFFSISTKYLKERYKIS